MSKKYKNIKKGAFLAGAWLIGLFGIGAETENVHAVPNGIQFTEPALNEGWNAVYENTVFRLYVKKYHESLCFAGFKNNGTPCGHCMVKIVNGGFVLCTANMNLVDPAVGHLFDNKFFTLFACRADPVTNCCHYKFNGVNVTVFGNLSYVVEE